MPFYRHLGMRLTKLSRGRAEMQVQVTGRLTQDAGVAHGGVAATLIDSAVGLAVCTMLKPEEVTTTVEMKVNFTAPAIPGLLRASARIIQRGKRIAVGEAEVRDRNRTLVAKGLATYIILGKAQRPVLSVS
jgi:uncharacterized protein (TIGR00369 family)